jgi:photosystem II stability/assembly factor-like uncharacterized protein
MIRRIVVLAAAAVVANIGAIEAQLSQPLDSTAMKAFKWRSIGPTNMGGRITDVEGLPSPSKTFYVAAAAGGIWKTTNNGISFQQVWNQDRVVAMGDIAIAPSDPDVIWAGTGEEDSRNSISPGGGVFKSTDGGMTWELKGLAETQVVGRIVVHPTNPDIVFVAAVGHIWDSNPERGLYRTRDGGETWELVKFISEEAGFVDVIMDPRDPNVLFASSWERVRGPWFLNGGGPGSALWKSTDGGDSWTEVVGNGFPTENKGRIGLDISLSNPDVMYAMVEAEEVEAEEDDSTGGNGLYRSDDGGDSWEKVNDANSRPFYYSQVRVDPQDPDRVYFSSTPIQFSSDGGKTAGTTTSGIHVDHHAMWIDPNDPDRIVVGNDGGIAITFDKGGNWAYLNNVALGQFYHVSYNMDVPYRVCGGLQDNGTWCAPSRLASGQIGKYHWATIGGGDGFYTAQDFEDPNIVWSESQGGNILRGKLATGESKVLQKPDWEKVWRPYQDTIVTLLEEGVAEDDARIQSLRERAAADSTAYDMRWNWNTPFLQSVHDRSHFYAGASMVVRSTDWGDGLEPISHDLTYADPEKIKVSTETTGGITPDVTGAETYHTIVTLAESPLQQGLLLVGTDDGRVWITRDDGGEWTELTDRFDGVQAETYVSRIEASRFDVDRFYVTFDGHRTNDFTPYVYATDDGGRSFRSIASNLPTGSVDYVHVIREDSRNEDLLFVGTDVGAYVSTNRGATWQRFMEGLPAVPVHDLQIHPRDRELIAATHGRSIWIVDIAPLQDLTDQLVADGVTLFEPKTAFQFGMEARGGESYGQAWFARPTPGSNAEISYFISEAFAAELKEAHDAERTAQKAQADSIAEQADSAAEQAGEQPADPPSARLGLRPRAEIAITDSEGEVIRTVRGSASAGINKVTWNFRGERPERPEMSPSQRKEAAHLAERAKHVTDSLVEAGWDEAMVGRITGLFTGKTDPQAMMRAFMGGGAGSGDPEAFRERPGEGQGGGMGGFGSFSQIRTLADLMMPGAGMQALMRRFFGGGGQAPLMEPGAYTITLKLGDQTFTQTLTVERVGGFEGDSAPFEF